MTSETINKETKTTETFCQSCGMPLTADEHLGTNADQSKNPDYCVYCYQNGQFTQDVTMEQMIDICLEHLNEYAADVHDEATPEEREQMKSKEGARAMMREYFPSLKRWKND